jgi:DNA-binding transcriptional regulator YbjK
MTFTEQLEGLEEELSEARSEGPWSWIEEVEAQIAELEDARLEAWVASLSSEDQAAWSRTLTRLSTGGFACDMNVREMIQRANGWNTARNNF